LPEKADPTTFFLNMGTIREALSNRHGEMTYEEDTRPIHQPIEKIYHLGKVLNQGLKVKLYWVEGRTDAEAECDADKFLRSMVAT